MVQLNINKASGGGHTCLRDCWGKECISLVTSISKATVITEKGASRSTSPGRLALRFKGIMKEFCSLR